MALARNISWGTYAIAFIISVLLFATGMLLGMQLVQSVNEGLAGDLESLKTRTTELELLLLLKQENATDMCGFYKDQLVQFDVQTTEFGQKIDFLERSRGRQDAAVQALKREYSLMQVRDFLLVRTINEDCRADGGINTILFFYTNENCPDCTLQGQIGPPLKKERQDVMIYAFDADLGLSVVGALERIYGVHKYPSLVVNGRLLEGLRSKEEVKGYLS